MMFKMLKPMLKKEEVEAYEKDLEELGPREALKRLTEKSPAAKKMMGKMMDKKKANKNSGGSKEEIENFTKRMKSHHNVSGLLSKYYPPQVATNEEFLKTLEEKPRDIPKAIYVHTPYCDKICSFCNLNRKSLDGSITEYSNYIASEFDFYGKTRYFKESKFEVVYFGGGTPSVYNERDLEVILKSIARNVKFEDEYEFTFETTLHNLTKSKIELMEKYGVNRFSVGIQSFNDKGRVFYNRTYNREVTMKKLQEVKEHFSGEVCIDIIYNYPSQSIEDVINDAKDVKQMDVGSVSYYSLMVQEGSDLSKEIEKGNVTMKEALERDKELFNHFTKELTEGTDYYTLELTKIAKKGRDNYRYIKVRNAGGDTFPIGVGAGGRVGNIGIYRMTKENHMMGKKVDEEILFEKLAGLYQFPTISKNDLRNVLTPERMDILMEKSKEFVEKGLMVESEKEYTLTSEGIFWGNNISVALLTHLASEIFKK